MNYPVIFIISIVVLIFLFILLYCLASSILKRKCREHTIIELDNLRKEFLLLLNNSNKLLKQTQSHFHDALKYTQDLSLGAHKHRDSKCACQSVDCDNNDSELIRPVPSLTAVNLADIEFIHYKSLSLSKGCCEMSGVYPKVKLYY